MGLKVNLPSFIWEIHRENLDFLGHSIEKGLYSVSYERLNTLIETYNFNCSKDITIDLIQYKPHFYVSFFEDIKKIREKYSQDWFDNIIITLAIFGYLMGEV